ncbi:unnamed protein product [Dracunculus medinensis]|uniref:Ephrin_rec_like domain-containing protein n=1 Tax=Dracunculus medinensis TaxID=318479 RepID=A0A0N4US22_DRAME|nr:unnamed protein product [Dracunculus medinensis]
MFPNEYIYFKYRITACALGTYKDVAGEGECRICPAHSRSPKIGSPNCQCDEGYYRAINETIHDGCSQLLLILSSEPNNFSSSTTEPPSKPSNLATVEIEQTSVVIEWDEPLILGGRKVILIN